MEQTERVETWVLAQGRWSLVGIAPNGRRKRRTDCHCSWIHNNHELRCAKTISLSDSHPEGWQEDSHSLEIEHIIMRIFAKWGETDPIRLLFRKKLRNSDWRKRRSGSMECLVQYVHLGKVNRPVQLTWQWRMHFLYILNNIFLVHLMDRWAGQSRLKFVLSLLDLFLRLAAKLPGLTWDVSGAVHTCPDRQNKKTESSVFKQQESGSRAFSLCRSRTRSRGRNF